MSRILERLLHIDGFLRDPHRQTAGFMAQKLEVSERTIRSDLDMLRDRYRAPIDFNRKQGYYYTDPDWRLPSITLTKGELFAVVLGARMLEQYAGSVYVEDLHSAIARLTERLPEQTWVDLQQVANERIMFRGGGGIDLCPQIWHGLEAACREQKSVFMKYYTASRDAASERTLDPYLLHVYRGTNPYVIGFCHQRQTIRWFRVDRIERLEVLNDRFDRDPQFDAKKHLEGIFQAEVGGKPIEVAIWFDRPTAPYIRERQWHLTQTLEEHPDGAVTMRMEVPGLNEVKRWVLGYGAGARVLNPPKLVEIVAAEVKGLFEFYLEAKA
jgi:predicted DNA-binding transcriptional regulator YafY